MSWLCNFDEHQGDFRMYKILFILLLSVVCMRCENEEEELVVQVKQGLIKGKYWKTWRNKTFVGFTSIPYAKPPIGDLRFKPPTPILAWENILIATDIHNVCPQINIFLKNRPVIGDEDCLYLNVYTPTLAKGEKTTFPVMFYIHGGSFFLGSASPDWLGPELLMEKDIILVTVNYRLGALGFLSTEDEIVPGNNALKDLSLALKWVYENVEYFGGDPNKITVFGNSAGGTMSQLFTLSSMTKHLIKGAIIQSGTAISIFATTPKNKPRRNAITLGTFVNCPVLSNKDLVDCLRNTSVDKILKGEAKFMSWDYDTTIPFRPIVEKDADGAFLTEDPVYIIKSNNASNISIMTGIVAQEGGFKAADIFSKPELIDRLNKYFNLIVPLSFGISTNKIYYGKLIKEFYFGNKSVDSTTKSQLTDMYSDGWFVHSNAENVELLAQYSKKDVYQYLFDYRGSFSYATLYNESTFDYGVMHTDELFYLLNREYLFRNYKPTESDLKMMDIMTTLWTNFAATGNPTPKPSSTIPNKWMPVKNGNVEYYHIKNNSDIHMAEGLFVNRTNFWKSMPITSATFDN